MRVAFAAGDIGGARALLPVARQAAARGLWVSAMAHGPFETEGDPSWHWTSSATLADPEFWADGPDLLFFATSVSDRAAFLAAKAAQSMGRKIVHVLDNWSKYAERLEPAGHQRLLPDIYAVMDELAAQAAEGEGVPASILRVSGHPGLAQLLAEAGLRSPPGTDGPRHLMFVSEPALSDSGGPHGIHWRGYEEAGVARAFLHELAAQGHRDCTVHVCPHPRETRAEVRDLWQALGNRYGINVQMVEPQLVRNCLHDAHAVVGMTSILLYEAWLLGKPAMSVQPGLCLPSLRELGTRPGVFFCDAIDRLPALLSCWMQETEHSARPPRDELLWHKNAAEQVLTLGLELARSKSSSSDRKKD